MRLTHVTAAAALGCGVDAQWLWRRQIAALGQVLPESRLYDCCEGRWSVLSLDIVVHRLCQVIGNGNSGSLHDFVVYHRSLA